MLFKEKKKVTPDAKKINGFLQKIAKFKKEHRLDLSLDEDLSIAVMNLVSLEEHFFFTGAKTGKTKYYDLLSRVREIRKELLTKIVKDAEGENWCISKHLLAVSMRLIEVGTKLYSQGKKQEAQKLFSRAYDLYSLFWGINLKLIKPKQVQKLPNNQIIARTKDRTKRPYKEKDVLMKKLNNLVQQLIDCCEE